MMCKDMVVFDGQNICASGWKLSLLLPDFLLEPLNLIRIITRTLITVEMKRMRLTPSVIFVEKRILRRIGATRLWQNFRRSWTIVGLCSMNLLVR
jgi:hypothetical protein